MPRTLIRFAALLTALGASACTAIAPGAWPPGTPIADARSTLGGPTGEFVLPNGGTRLEFARGSFGRQTYMLDFDPGGRLVQSQQVLTEDNFAKIVPGMPADEVRMRIGRPADIFNVGWQRLQVWNYRWWQGDCVWFQVSIGQQSGRVTEAGYGHDPMCDAPTRM